MLGEQPLAYLDLWLMHNNNECMEWQAAGMPQGAEQLLLRTSTQLSPTFSGYLVCYAHKVTWTLCKNI